MRKLFIDGTKNKGDLLITLKTYKPDATQDDLEHDLLNYSLTFH